MHIPYATTGPLDLDHTRITCLELFHDDTNDHAHALVVYQDTRHPQQYPTTIMQAQWTRLPDGRIRTTMTPYSMTPLADTMLSIKISTPIDTPNYLLYHTGDTAWPTHAEQVSSILMETHQAMLAIHADTHNRTLIDDLGIAMYHIIRRIYVTEKYDVLHPMALEFNPLFWRRHSIYTHASDAIDNKENTSSIIHHVELVNMNDIALPIPEEIKITIQWEIEMEFSLDSNPPAARDVYFLRRYTVIPIHDLTIPILDRGHEDMSQHEQIDIIRSDRAAIERVRPYFHPKDIDPILGAMHP